MATVVPDLSPTIIEGLAKVKRGFSIPPNGKEGGKITSWYIPQVYGIKYYSTVFKYNSKSLNSFATVEIWSISVITYVLKPTYYLTTLPAIIANKYDGIGQGISNVYVV